MSQVIVVNSNLKIANNLCNILENRDITVIKAGSDNSKPECLSRVCTSMARVTFAVTNVRGLVSSRNNSALFL